MRVLVAGAHGFLGSHIAAALAAAGHHVVGAGRDLTFARRILPQIEWIPCDFNRDTAPEVWRARLAGVDAVVNAVGVLQATRRDRLQRIHVDTPMALYEACRQAGIRRFVQISALGIETADTEYAYTKRAGDAALASTDLDWVVLRASLVVGRGSYGGTSLMRGLAGLPGFIPLMGGGEFHLFQPILMRDFTRAVVAMLEPGAPSRAIVPVAGPVQMTLKEIVLTLRQWLGFGRAHTLSIPGSLMRLAAKFGDALGWLGVPTAFRTTSIAQMEAGSYVAAADQPQRLPKDAAPLRDGLFAEPATIEDRWHARLYFVKPLLRTVLAGYILYAGIWPLRIMYQITGEFPSFSIDSLDALTALARFVVTPAAFLFVGVAFLLRRWVQPAGALMIGLMLATVTFELFSPFFGYGLNERFGDFLFGQFAPLEIAAATLVVLAIERER